MIYLEKIEVTEEYIKYYYYPWKGAEKGIVVYFPKTGVCRTEKLCEDDSEFYQGYRTHSYCRIMEYVEKKEYPEHDMVAWG
ncbi:MAG: hypothetical protein IJY62_05320 [Clostridia bacterium]|nr:hypothetical protein [Clostridia bacterium]